MLSGKRSLAWQTGPDGFENQCRQRIDPHRSVEHHETLWLLSRKREVAIPHPAVKLEFAALHAIQRLLLTSEPLTRELHRHIEQKRQTWRQTTSGELVKRAKFGEVEAAAVSLVRERGVGKAVAQYDRTPRKGRGDSLGDMLGTGSQIEEQFATAVHFGMFRRQHHPTDPLRNRGTTGFACEIALNSHRHQRPGRPLDLGALAAPVDALERDEQPAGFRVCAGRADGDLPVRSNYLP